MKVEAIANLIEDLDATQCDISESDFSESCLLSPSFEMASCIEGSFEHAEIDDACFAWSYMSCASFKNADISNADFAGSVLKGVSFEGARLKNVVFSQCDLSEASFKDAELMNVVIQGCVMHGTDWEGASIDDQQIFESLEELWAYENLINRSKESSEIYL